MPEQRYTTAWFIDLRVGGRVGVKTYVVVSEAEEHKLDSKETKEAA